MRVRDATPADLPALEPLWRDFEAEIPEPPWVDVDIDDELNDLAETLNRGNVAVVAENENGEMIGFSVARKWGSRLGRITDLYVIPTARGQGLARRLIGQVVERLHSLGLDTVQIEVVATNEHARAIYARWGFKEQELTLATSLDELAQSVARPRVGAPVAKKPVTSGFYRGRTIGYYDFGPIELKSGNRLAPIWTVTNGARGQHNIVDTVPGQAGYTPLWQLNKVTFKPGVSPHLLRSRVDVAAAKNRGEVTVVATSTVVNCPVLGFGQKRVAGFSAAKTIHYYDLGPVKVAPGNLVLPLVAVTNGVSGQHNITEETIAPGATDYPPLWSIVKATWTSSAHKRLLTSYTQVEAAEKAGKLELHKTALVVNCPLVP